MRLERLEIKNFRNYTEQGIEFSPGNNYFSGDNGQGKTNIIEAIFCLGLLKSFRSSNESELVQIGASGYEISAIFVSDILTKHRMTIAYNEKKKGVFLDGKRASTYSTIIGNVPIVLFSPEDHRITGGGPAERRKFLDILLCQASNSYLSDLKEYNKIIRQRNSLLQKIAKKGAHEKELDAWDATAAEYGSRLAKQRKRFIDETAEQLQQTYKEISGKQVVMKAVYVAADSNVFNGKAAYIKALHAKRQKEILRQQTLIGPHRDDVMIYLDDRDIRSRASRGEQKSAILALKINEYNYLKQKKRKQPILLLDDIYSELDEQRQKNILTSVSRQGQTIITSTNPIIPTEKEDFVFLVKNGSVERQHLAKP